MNHFQGQGQVQAYGWTCQNCNHWVPPGTNHQCLIQIPSAPLTTADLDRLIIAVNEIAVSIKSLTSKTHELIEAIDKAGQEVREGMKELY